MRRSDRGNVDPFMVMDVAQATRAALRAFAPAALAVRIVDGPAAGQGRASAGGRGRMRVARLLAGLCLVLLLALAAARADEAGAPAGRPGLTVLAHLDPAASRLADAAGGIALDLAISRALPYRVALRGAPPRLVIDFSELDFGASRPAALNRSAHVRALAWGRFRPGWSRLVAELDGPFRIASDGQKVAPDGSAVIGLRLTPATAAEFAASVAGAVPEDTDRALPAPARVDPAHRRQTGAAPLVVVLDPGHGGIDPGAEAAGESEAAVMLGFARELAEVLRRAGMRVVMTRDEDVFVPLETRISVARAAGADVLLSLHADALAEGEARGATIYRLADAASDAASARLAERHDRGDLLAGLDLSGQDDAVAGVLMDLARRETAPRADRLARELADCISAANLAMHRHPIQEAAFSVLKAPDIPSLLLELGFLSADADRARLADAGWRARMQGAILAALRAWAVADAAEARLIRQ